MEYRLNIKKQYIGIPVKTAPAGRQNLKQLDICCDEGKVFEFWIPEFPAPANGEAAPVPDYCAYLPAEQLKGRECRLRGDFPLAFYRQIVQTDERTGCDDPAYRPALHYTAGRGWINDPNGLVYHNGIYHLYYQYNPVNTEWENMSWGHAAGNDLLHWNEQDAVMFPDEYGTVFSGCGLVNERGLLGLPKDALLFFYTAAGGGNEWSRGKPFIQRLSYSLDGGKTLIRHHSRQLDSMADGNRDPKVFWHEESQAYIMVLYMTGNTFALFRSADLINWEKSQLLTLEAAWECPDLFPLSADDGTVHWVFWSADGFYFLGDFDGRSFTLNGRRRMAYGTRIPYAAQTYSGISGRTVSVAWLRTRHEGRLYTGAMALPRELSLVKRKTSAPSFPGKRQDQETQGEDYLLRMSLPREFSGILGPWRQLDVLNGYMEAAAPGRPFCLKIGWEEESRGSCVLEIGPEKWRLDRGAGCISRQEEVFQIPEEQKLTDLYVTVDRGIVEITANHDIIYLVYETTDYQLSGKIRYSGDRAAVSYAGIIE